MYTYGATSMSRCSFSSANVILCCSPAQPPPWMNGRTASMLFSMHMEAIFSLASSVTVITLHLSNHYYGLLHIHTGYLVCKYTGHKYSLHNYSLCYRKPLSSSSCCLRFSSACRHSISSFVRGVLRDRLIGSWYASITWDGYGERIGLPNVSCVACSQSE